MAGSLSNVCVWVFFFFLGMSFRIEECVLSLKDVDVFICLLFILIFTIILSSCLVIFHERESGLGKECFLEIGTDSCLPRCDDIPKKGKLFWLNVLCIIQIYMSASLVVAILQS